MKTPRPRRRQTQISAPAIDWEQIRDRAAAFANQWTGEKKESAEAQTFWNGFFGIFGRDRRGLAYYEYQAMRGRGLARIDLLWPKMLAVEHKSGGGDLNAAQTQLENYINILEDEKKPRYGLVCDFAHFRFTDFTENRAVNFPLSELPANVELFGFFIEHRNKRLTLELKASRDAVAKMGDIYDALREAKYKGETDRLLVRLLFCMFADDTGIFEKNLFLNYLEDETKADGSDFGMHLCALFDVLNTPVHSRPKNLSGRLAAFPFVNGELFDESAEFVHFDEQIRETVLDACRFNWKDISPDIFGSLFQSVRDAEARRSGGEHYTSEENIMKVIRPLFLDGLEAELECAGKNKGELRKFHDKIANLRFLDPACGCGNFLIISYRELRRLEMKILVRLGVPSALNVESLVRVTVKQFYGLEIDEFPARIARAAMWLVADQMNRELGAILGKYIPSIPLTVAADVREKNALVFDWNRLPDPEKISYIFGNPPFGGKQFRSKKQQEDMALVFGDAPGAGNLDYVAAWYAKAAKYIRGTEIKCAFVSTNSITQGEQAAVLWRILQAENIKIHFAHRSFPWRNEAGNVAAVSVVIVGFARTDAPQKTIYDYSRGATKPHAVAAQNINMYLVDGDDIVAEPRAKPFCGAPEIVFGSMPNDGGHFFLDDKEKRELLHKSPEAKPFIRPAIGAREFLHGIRRWCVWLEDAEPSAFRKISALRRITENVEEHRKNSDRSTTNTLAAQSHLFGEIRQPKNSYVFVPGVSSHYREYIPMGFFTKNTIVTNLGMIVPKADLYHFGVMSSAMHMAWMRTVGGRLGTGYRYSNKMVYNTFPWLQNISAAQKQKISDCAQAILDVRKNYSASTLADMYSNMPRDLLAAHRDLDRAVDRAYRPTKFADESARLNFLFAEYRRLIDEESAAAASAHPAVFVKPRNEGKNNAERSEVPQRLFRHPLFGQSAPNGGVGASVKPHFSRYAPEQFADGG